MHLTDLDLLTSLSRPTLAPDGSFAVYASARPDQRSDRTVGQLWRIELPADGSCAPAPRRLTRGLTDAAPQLSPDGSTVAFLRPDARGRRQLHLLDARGGEPLAITDQLLGVGSFVWSPDGTHLAFTARVPEPGRYGSVDGLGPAAEAPRRITGIRWHANGVGFTTDRPTQVFVVPTADPGAEPDYPLAPRPDGQDEQPTSVPAAAIQLTEQPSEHSAIAFTADSAAVLTVREEYEQDRRDLRNQLLSVPVVGGTETLLLERDDGLRTVAVAVAGDGTVGVLASRPAYPRDSVAPAVALWLLESSGPRRLTDPEVLDVASSGADLQAFGEDWLLRPLSRGRTHLVRVGRDGRARTVVGGDVAVQGADATHAGERERVIVTLAAADTPGRLALVEPAATADAVRTLVDTGGPLRAAGLAQPRELEITGRSGYPVHGWLATPEGEGPFPALLLIHGGPFAAYGVSVLDEVQVLVGAGYAVAYANPRGSAGYGRDHGRAVRRAFGTVDFEDVIDFFEGALAADDRLDAEQLGIMGGSYGGYLTAWVIAHDHRFRGAIVERGFLDPVSFQGTSDIGTYYGDEYIGTDDEELARTSAFARAGQVRTPTLVIHAADDLRCPLEQGTRYYTALKRAGVATEMLIFPGENHELTRSGRPRHRAQRFAAILEWWERVFAGSQTGR